MAFEKKPVSDTDTLITPSGGDREVIDLSPGEEVVGKIVDFISYTVPTSINPEGSTFYAVILEDDDGNEGILSAGADTNFGKQLRNAFADKTPDEQYVLKEDFRGKKVRLAKIEKISSKGQIYHSLGYEVLD